MGLAAARMQLVEKLQARGAGAEEVMWAVWKANRLMSRHILKVRLSAVLHGNAPL